MRSVISYFKIAALLLSAMPVIWSCDDDTASIGAIVMPNEDVVTTTSATYKLYSHSVLTDSVLANTNECYIGSIIDPETRVRTTCDFLAQFHVMENYKFPNIDKMVKDETGKVVADSCVLRIYFDEYYGDSLTTMKLYVQELDTNKVMEENELYYTNIDPADYVNENTEVKKSVAFSVLDLTCPDEQLNSSQYYRSVPVKLTADYGSFILNKYYENPDFFRNSYNMIHHVCPGFYFKTVGGVGAVIKSYVSALDVYFSYHTTTSAGKDTLVVGMQRMGATEEVIQNTSIQNSIPASMLDESNPYTYIKSPAGVHTELTLPVDEIVAGEHYNDTINSARLIFRCFNSETTEKSKLNPPTTILLVRKSKQYSFFEEENVSDNVESFLATYSSSANAYDFSNIAQLITLMKNERDRGAGVVVGDTEEQRRQKYAEWEKESPDWNKVVLLPVATETSTTTSSLGYTSTTLLRVRNDFGISSVKLEGGTTGDLSLSVVYSRFSK